MPKSFDLFRELAERTGAASERSQIRVIISEELIKAIHAHDGTTVAALDRIVKALDDRLETNLNDLTEIERTIN